MTISVFLTVFLFLQAPAGQPQAIQTPAMVETSFQENSQPLYHLVQNSEDAGEGEENAGKPYEGFTLVAVLMMLLALAVVVFVVYKVMQGMQKNRRGDQ